VGTSAAAPMVSGIAALVRSARPGYSRAQVETILKAATVQTPFEFTRFGRVDAFKALYRAVHGRMPVATPLHPAPPLLDPEAEVTLKRGNHAGYRFDVYGAMLRGVGARTTVRTFAHTSKVSTIPGRLGSWYYMVDGPLAGYWVPESSEVFLTPSPTPTPTPSPSPDAAP
jgi:hypothetical protein